MTTHTIELDPETEAILEKIIAGTGYQEAFAIKQGLKALYATLEQATVTHPYEIYSQLDLGEGGYALGTSEQSRQDIINILRRKHRR